MLQTRNSTAPCAGLTLTRPLGTAKAVGTGPRGLVDPRGLWCGLKGEIALLPPPVQRGVLGDPAIPFKLPQ